MVYFMHPFYNTIIMKKALFVYFALITYCFLSCSEKSVNKVTSLVEYDSISVSIDYPILPAYSKLSSFVGDKAVYAVGYNHHLHSLDFVNFSGGKHHVVEFQREGADAILPPVAFCLIGDYIVWEDASGVVLLTLEGKVIKRFSLGSDGEYLMKPLGVTNAALVNLYKGNDHVFSPMTSAEMNENVFIGKSLNLKNSALDFLPIKYPQEIVGMTNILGGLAFPNITDNGNRILYSFPCSSMVYVYDKKSEKMTSIDMKTYTIVNQLDIEGFATMSPRKKFEAESTSARFGETYYSVNLGKYYRVHYGKKEHLFDKTRETYLMLFDENTGSSIEYLLPRHFSEQYMVLDDVIYFMYTNDDDSIFKYAKIDLKNL